MVKPMAKPKLSSSPVHSLACGLNGTCTVQHPSFGTPSLVAALKAEVWSICSTAGFSLATPPTE